MKSVLFLMFTVLLPLLSSQAVSACVCGSAYNPTPEQVKAQYREELRKADIVFSGEVVEIDTFKVRFRVERVWKGEKAEGITLPTGTKDNGDGTITTSTCDYRFKMGEKFLVYGWGSEGGMMETSQCSGTGLLKDSEERVRFLEEEGMKAKSFGPTAI